MKSQILYTVIISCLFASLVNAQNWGADGARWWYDYSNFAFIGYTEIFVNGDTLLDNKNAKIFQKRTNYYHQVTGEYQVFERRSEYMYEQEAVVYLWNGNNFDTLYHFNGNVGDTWRTKGTFNLTVIAKILEKGNNNLLINGRALKWSKVEYRLDRPGYERFILMDTIVEKIGNLHSYMLPWDYFAGQMDGNEGGYLRCYQDNEIGHVRLSIEDIPCDFVTATDEIEFNNFIQISPNPFTNIIKVAFTNPLTTALELVIHTVEGREIKRLKLPTNTEQLTIPLNELQQGYYFITLMEEGEVRYATKIVKL